jgi:hypothetical protein
VIATVLAPAQGSSTGIAAAWGTPGDASDTHLAEPNVLQTQLGGAPEPAIFGVARKPVAGLRGIVTGLVRTGIPRLPLGPSKVARMGQGQNRASLATPKPINKVQQYVPAPSAEQAGDWYQYLS